MARTAKITNANVAPSRNTAGLVGNTPVRAQDFNDLAGDYISSSDASAQSVASALSVTGAVTLSSTLAGNQLLVENAAADDTLTAAESGKLFIFSDVDGAVLTLPDSGAGDIIGTYYDFFVGISATSNAHKIVNTDTTNEKMYGNLYRIDTDTSDTLVAMPALVGDNYSAISMDGTTKGILGSYFRVINTAADRWFVQGTLLVNGTAASAWATS